MDANQEGRVRRALEVLNESVPEGPRTTADILNDLAVKVGKLDYWLRDMLSLISELDGMPPADVPRITRKYGG